MPQGIVIYIEKITMGKPRLCLRVNTGIFDKNTGGFCGGGIETRTKPLGGAPGIGAIVLYVKRGFCGYLTG